MDKIKSITQDILEHKLAYEQFGKKTPPFLIFAADHKVLVEYTKHLMPKEDLVKCTMIATYFGVDLIVVQRIDPYC